MVAAKRRVVPVEKIIVLRLVLCETLLLSCVFKKVNVAIKDNDIPFYGWTDSEIAFSRLNSSSRSLVTIFRKSNIANFGYFALL